MWGCPPVDGAAAAAGAAVAVAPAAGAAGAAGAWVGTVAAGAPPPHAARTTALAALRPPTRKSRRERYRESFTSRLLTPFWNGTVLALHGTEGPTRHDPALPDQVKRDRQQHHER